MRRFVVALLSAMAMSAVSANAADLPTKAPIYKAPPPVVAYNWTGCYVGGNLGWGHTHHNLSTNADPAPGNNINAVARTAIINAGSDSINSDGVTGGVQVGCNYQPPGQSFVFGAEGDFNFLDGDASRDTGNYVEPASGRTVRSVDEIKMKWFSTIRGRLGFAFDHLLVYGTGGLAIAQINASKQFYWDFVDGCTIVNGLQECHVGGSDTTRVGWTIGGGLEWAFAPNWSAKAEYLYADFGDISYNTTNNGTLFAGAAAQVATHTASTTLQVARVGVNFHF
jgi:outer membrane immunogenic protein